MGGFWSNWIMKWARVEKSRDGVASQDEFFFCTHTSHLTRFPAHFLLQFRPTEENA